VLMNATPSPRARARGRDQLVLIRRRHVLDHFEANHEIALAGRHGAQALGSTTLETELAARIFCPCLRDDARVDVQREDIFRSSCKKVGAVAVAAAESRTRRPGASLAAI